MLRRLVAAAAVLPHLAVPAGAQVFSNPTEVTIPTSGPASPYPSQILVSGVATPITQLTVTLSNLSHTWTADLDVLLAGPQGQNVVLLSDAAPGSDLEDVTLVFDDAAAQQPELGVPLTSGSYRPANLSGTSDPFPAPAPTPSGAGALATFAGTDANGLWSLYVVDDSGGDGGTLGGWSLRLPEPGAAGQGAAAAAALALARRRRSARRG